MKDIYNIGGEFNAVEINVKSLILLIIKRVLIDNFLYYLLLNHVRADT